MLFKNDGKGLFVTVLVLVLLFGVGVFTTYANGGELVAVEIEIDRDVVVDELESCNAIITDDEGDPAFWVKDIPEALGKTPVNPEVSVTLWLQPVTDVRYEYVGYEIIEGNASVSVAKTPVLKEKPLPQSAFTPFIFTPETTRMHWCE